VDSLESSYFNLNGNPYEVLYFDSNGTVTSDSLFYRTDSNTIVISGNYGLLIGKNDFLPVTEGAGVIYPSSTTVCFAGVNNENGLYTSKIITLSEALTVHTVEADTERVTMYAKTNISEPVPVAGIAIAEVDSSVSFAFSNESYYFPRLNGTAGQTLMTGGGNPAQLYWGNQILTDTATLNFGSIGNNSYEDLTVTVTGASTGDVVSFGTPTAAAVSYATFTAWVSATNTVTIRCVNVHSSNINPGSGVFKVKVFKD
jgi:hypothetical protein